MRYDFDMKPNQVVLYMDILGFKEAIKNIKKPKSDESKDDVQLNFQWLNELIHDEMNASKDCIKFLFVSDSLILSTGIENINQLLEKMFKLQHILICSDFVVRGAICIGDLYHEKNMCGEPYICAIELK